MGSEEEHEERKSPSDSDTTSSESLSDLEESLHPEVLAGIKKEVQQKIRKQERERMSLEEEFSLVTTILKPVCLTMIIVIMTVKTITMPGTTVQPIYFVYEEQSSDSGGTRLLGSLLNALVFVAMIVVMTLLFVCLYYYRCLKLIFGWLILSTGCNVFFAFFFLNMLNRNDAGYVRRCTFESFP